MAKIRPSMGLAQRQLQDDREVIDVGRAMTRSQDNGNQLAHGKGKEHQDSNQRD
jgi:hypothetical protein